MTATQSAWESIHASILPTLCTGWFQTLGSDKYSHLTQDCIQCKEKAKNQDEINPLHFAAVEYKNKVSEACYMLTRYPQKTGRHLIQIQYQHKICHVVNKKRRKKALRFWRKITYLVCQFTLYNLVSCVSIFFFRNISITWSVAITKYDKASQVTAFSPSFA